MEATVNELVKRAVKGSRQALETIVEQIREPVYALALRMLFHPEDAEDATQEILIKIITHLNGFRFEGSFRSWTLRIAANHLKTVKKKKSKRLDLTIKESEQVIDRAEARGWFANPMQAPDPYLEVEMISACTQALLQALNREQREAFILGTIIEVSSIEGAYILNISPTAFRKRLSRARMLIKDFLSANCGFFDETNRCNCAGIYTGHVQMGWLDPHKPLFAPVSEGTDPPATLRQYIKELDELGKISVMFKSFPRNKSSLELASIIKATVQQKNYRILSDTQIT